MTGTVLVVIAHGSRLEAANHEVKALAHAIEHRSKQRTIAGFLEIASPNIAEAMAQAAALEPHRIVVLPYFLTQGRHVQRDIRAQIEHCRALYRGIAIELLDYLGKQRGILETILNLLAGLPHETKA